jgi:hypothetical protein
MMSPMVDTSSSNGGPGGGDQGVFANLPRTRPQRDSPRRTAARKRSSARAQTATARKRDGSSTADSQRPRKAAREQSKAAAAAKPAPPKRRAPTPRAARRPPAPAPRQGFESESQRGSRSLQPPGATDLVVSAAELVTELTKAGLSRGERLVRDLVSRRP